MHSEVASSFISGSLNKVQGSDLRFNLECNLSNAASSLMDSVIIEFDIDFQ
jgi:hypothetical protein